MVFRRRTIGSAIRRAIRLYGWVLVRLVPFLGPVRVIYRGGRLPQSAIFVANHNSAIDPYLFGAIPVENSFVTSWPFKIPVYNIFMRLAGYANADKGWPDIKAKGRALLKAGSFVTIWPEGHRSRDGQLGRFKRGAFRLAVETGKPLVPVCILGSGTVLPPGQRFLCPGKITLVVLEPVYPGEGADKQELVSRLRAEVRDNIECTLTEYGHFQAFASSGRE